MKEEGFLELQTPIIEQIKEDYDIDYLYIDATKLSSDDKNEILKVINKKAIATRAIKNL